MVYFMIVSFFLYVLIEDVRVYLQSGLNLKE